jgi:hypothetical protein
VQKSNLAVIELLKELKLPHFITSLQSKKYQHAGISSPDIATNK